MTIKVFLTVVFLYFYSLNHLTNGHVFRMGACPSIDVMKDFSMKKFMGQWFVIQKFRTSSNCMMENITQTGDDYFISESLEPMGVGLHQKGKVSFVEGQPESVMKVSYPITAPLGDQNYWVIMTDYDSYAAVWSCQRIMFGHRESAQIMSRKPTLDIEIVRKIRKRIESFGINEHYFSVIDQGSCQWDENGVITRRESTDRRKDDLSFKVGPFKITPNNGKAEINPFVQPSFERFVSP